MEPFQRLVSNGSTVFVGVDREEAEINAANEVGGTASVIPRLSLDWPSLKKYDNDLSPASPSPFSGVVNPDYIWQPPISDGQTRAFAIASNSFTVTGIFIPPISSFERATFSVCLSAFSDNAMTAKITLFEQLGGNYVKVPVQPVGLSDFILTAGTPNTPSTGLTETIPYNWQDIRFYSTSFTAPLAVPIGAPRTFKVVISFMATNYLPIAPVPGNPAGLQFIADLYQEVDEVFG